MRLTALAGVVSSHDLVVQGHGRANNHRAIYNLNFNWLAVFNANGSQLRLLPFPDSLNDVKVHEWPSVPAPRLCDCMLLQWSHC